MKRKWIFITGGLFLLSSCNAVFGYPLIFEDSQNILVEPLKRRYPAGENVEVKAHILMDADLTFYLDGIDIGNPETGKQGDLYYASYSFVMPNHEATLTYSIEDGFLPRPESYHVHVQEGLPLISPLGSYSEGEEVIVQTEMLQDGQRELFVDGQTIGFGTTCQNDQGTTYQEYSFTMPGHDVELTYETDTGTMLSELFPILDILSSETVQTVSCKSSFSSIAYGFDRMTQTSSKEDIEQILANLRQTILFRTDKLIAPGASYQTLTLEGRNGVLAELRVCDDVLAVNGMRYRMTSLPVPEGKEYVVFGGECESEEILEIGTAEKKRYSNALKGIAICPFDSDKPMTEYVLKSPYGQLLFLDQRTFLLRDSEFLEPGIYQAMDTDAFGFIFEEFPLPN